MSTTENPQVKPALSRKDFVSNQEPRWCPGCGDYSILAQVQKVMPEFGIPKEKIVFVSGIGCSSRFPYYMNTYGFHTIHGRAPTIATGIRLARPDLTVWLATGDGDALAIGGNHLIHALRRNIGVKIVLFNNRIYGLTKGQYSPTSEMGKKTKSTPSGSLDHPFSTLSLAIGAEGSFVARSFDTEIQHLQAMLKRVGEHKGTTLLEIYQNCPVFNDDAFVHITDKTHKADRVLYLEHGKPLLFGKNKDKGIRIGKNFVPEVVDVGDGAGQVPLSEIAVHDETIENPSYAFMLSRMEWPNYPVPVGVLRNVSRAPYEDLVTAQREQMQASRGKGDVAKLLRSGETWVIQPDN
ncbi:MAG TPA: 2-oxoacid:ferredoxin oxidoreductase subunit beta [Pseudomonadota bacterium]|jgi:2-oxoglutarate ferredoxin oxidoreductase subunit beta|nr:2-oxoacid:ferredoxin oxidoreductase subunit beta [Pseudomonadota bacterium]HNI59948.1 2-oxoacid:ferredoxin oxidoreductase subunit beta [Pseudomonadota bacterium]